MKKDNCILIAFQFSKAKLIELVRQELEYFMSDTNYHFDGYDIKVTLIKDEEIKLFGSGKVIKIFLPVNFWFYKSGGLFSVEGAGKIEIELDITMSLDDALILDVKSDLFNHRWIESPVIKVGIINFPVETLSNLAIKKMHDDLTEKLDKMIEDKVNIPELVKGWRTQYLQNKNINVNPDIFLNTDILEIKAGLLSEESDRLLLNVLAEADVNFSDHIRDDASHIVPKFEWEALNLESMHQQITGKFSYIGIGNFILQNLNDTEVGGKPFIAESVHIRFTDEMEIKMNVVSPIKALLTIYTNPQLDFRTGILKLENLKIDLVAQNFFYRLTSPVVEKIIQKKIESALPFEVNTWLNNNKQKFLPVFDKEAFFKMDLKTSLWKISAVQLNSDSVESTITIENPVLNITI